MITVQAASDAGSRYRPNEDWWQVSESGNALVAVILDGVGSSGTGCIHGTGWYVHQLGTALIDTTSNLRYQLPDALREAISRVSCQHPFCHDTNPTAPAAAVGAVRMTSEKVEWLTLADVSITVSLPDRTHVLTDDRVDAIAPALQRTVADYALGTSEHGAALDTLITEQLKWRNRPHGYWVAQGDTHAADQALTGSAATSDVAEIMIATDGAMRLSTWGLCTAEKLLVEASDHGPDHLIRTTRATEHADPYGRKHPRFKHHDDATCVVLSRENAT